MRPFASANAEIATRPVVVDRQVRLEVGHAVVGRCGHWLGPGPAAVV